MPIYDVRYKRFVTSRLALIAALGQNHRLLALVHMGIRDCKWCCCFAMAGTRSCTGELLARQEIFLFFTGLLQNFDLLPAEGQKVVEFKEQVSVTVGPCDYELRVVPRAVA